MDSANMLNIKYIRTNDPIPLLVAPPRPVSVSTRDVLFCRIVGIDCADAEYVEGIREIDRILTKSGAAPYLRLSTLAAVDPGWDFADFSAAVDLALRPGGSAVSPGLRLPFSFGDGIMDAALHAAYGQVVSAYCGESGVSPSMAKNFAVKLLFWIKTYLPRLYSGGFPEMFPKVLFTGGIKKHDSLFLCLLTRIGCDVVYMSSDSDFPAGYTGLTDVSELVAVGARRKLSLPIPEMPRQTPAAPVASAQAPPLTLPVLGVMTSAAGQDHMPPPSQSASATATRPADLPGNELTFEQLANLAPSVVMIKVFDKDGECFKSGSGVVISEKGYILTNCHVIGGGQSFTVRFENDANEYQTSAVVKYHTDFDLALIRVDRACPPIRVLDGGSLARGQKVVAIGSPLGLFNTVSDGIISGFRQFERVSMIQFTAPTSKGSSGGALLDMYGRLIGIITAGFDDGQNLNLAVDHTTIQAFACNFL